MTSPDDVNLQAEIEFELYLSELTILAAEHVGISANEFMDKVEESDHKMPTSVEDFKAMLKEAFLNGFHKGVSYTSEENR